MNLLFKSKMYYQKEYNKIGIAEIVIFNILRVCRFIELLIEVPVRKLFKK